MARLACSIFSWNLDPRKGGHATPNLPEVTYAYALLGGIKLSWADILLKDMCDTHLLPHTSEVMHILDHFDVDLDIVSCTQDLAAPYSAGSLKKMFPDLYPPPSAPASSSVPPAPTTSETIPPIPPSSSGAPFQPAHPRPTGPVFTETPSFVHTDYASVLPHPDCRAPHTPLVPPHPSCIATHFPTPPPARTSVEEQLQLFAAMNASWQEFAYSYLRGIRLSVDAQIRGEFQQLYSRLGMEYSPPHVPDYYPHSPSHSEQHHQEHFDPGQGSGTAHEDILDVSIDDFGIPSRGDAQETAQRTPDQSQQQQHQPAIDDDPPLTSVTVDPVITSTISTAPSGSSEPPPASL